MPPDNDIIDWSSGAGEQLAMRQQAFMRSTLAQIREQEMARVAYAMYDSSAEPFTPEQEKVVEITEYDELPVDYDADVTCEDAKLDDNKDFYEATKGVLDKTCEIYANWVKELVPFVEKDEFFTSNFSNVEESIHQYITHAILSNYLSEDGKESSTFKDLKKGLHNNFNRRISGNYDWDNTYLFKNIDTIESLSIPYLAMLDNFDGEINPSTDYVMVIYNGEQYQQPLHNTKKVKRPYFASGGVMARPVRGQTVTGGQWATIVEDGTTITQQF